MGQGWYLVLSESGIEFYRGIFSFIGVLIVAAIPVWFGARAFFRQKEHELVHERYLEKGFDELAATAERALNAHNCNWSYALNVLKKFRDVPNELKPVELDISCFTVVSPVFPYAAAGRVIRVTQSRAIWEAIQLIVAFGNRSYSLCAIEIPMAINAGIEGRLKGDNKELTKEASDHLETLMTDADIYLDALGQVNVIAFEFETSRFNFKSIREFYMSEAVKNAVLKLEEFVKQQSPKLK